MDKGKINFNLDLNLKNNQISNYEINGFVKNLFLNFKILILQKSSFIYLIKEKVLKLIISELSLMGFRLIQEILS